MLQPLNLGLTKNDKQKKFKKICFFNFYKILLMEFDFNALKLYLINFKNKEVHYETFSIFPIHFFIFFFLY